MADIKNDYATGLISCYLSDSSGLTVDLHGTNTLTNNNTVTTGTSLGQGTTGDFDDASSQYLSVSDAVFDDLGTNYSISARFELDDLSSIHTIVGKWGSGSARKFILWVTTGGVVQFLWRNGASTAGTTASIAGTISAGTTYVIGITFSTNQVSFYKDGVFVNTVSGQTDTSASKVSDLNIGSQDGTSRFIDGRVNQVVIYSTSISAAYHTALGVSPGVPYEDAPATSIKEINGLAQASVKEVNGLAIASIKSMNGLSNVS